eukprot:786912-Amphidinium_carterae.1
MIICLALLQSKQVGRVECQSEQCNRAKAKARQACRVLVSLFQIQELRVAAKEQDGVDVRKQRNESVENWEAWPKQHHHEPRELQQRMRTFHRHACATKKAPFRNSKGRYGESDVSKFGIQEPPQVLNGCFHAILLVHVPSPAANIPFRHRVEMMAKFNLSLNQMTFHLQVGSDCGLKWHSARA